MLHDTCEDSSNDSLSLCPSQRVALLVKDEEITRRLEHSERAATANLASTASHFGGGNEEGNDTSTAVGYYVALRVARYSRRCAAEMWGREEKERTDVCCRLIAHIHL